MAKVCECGPECPTCGGQPNKAIDFYDYIPVLEAAFERIKSSIERYGAWENYDQQQVFAAISSEFNEYWRACAEGRRDGAHGQIDELYDVIVTAAKGILRLSHLEAPDGPFPSLLALPAERDEGASDDVLLVLEDSCYAVGFYDFTAAGWMTRYGQAYGCEGLPAVLRWLPLP